MCGNADSCRRQGQEVRDPKKCFPEQIRECHGNATEHPCVKGEMQCELRTKNDQRWPASGDGG
ncbi:MAG: hypothetical protein ACUVRS_04895 [Armatimonadota bacterium]